MGKIEINISKSWANLFLFLMFLLPRLCIPLIILIPYWIGELIENENIVGPLIIAFGGFALILGAIDWDEKNFIKQLKEIAEG